VTAGERLIEQGRQLGLEQGMQKSLLGWLRQRFGEAVDHQVEQRIAMASIDQLETWSERVLSAATLAELLAD
jgi:hypothetical protein